MFVAIIISLQFYQGNCSLLKVYNVWVRSCWLCVLICLTIQTLMLTEDFLWLTAAFSSKKKKKLKKKRRKMGVILKPFELVLELRKESALRDSLLEKNMDHQMKQYKKSTTVGQWNSVKELIIFLNVWIRKQKMFEGVYFMKVFFNLHDVFMLLRKVVYIHLKRGRGGG